MSSETPCTTASIERLVERHPIALTRARTAAYRPLGGEGRLTRAGRYRLGTRLGLGGMGAVYEAWDPELNRRVAVKLMRPRSGPDATEAQARLRREAQSMAALHHPNVLSIFDVGLTPSGVFLAMPLIEGLDLARWLRKEQPSWSRIVEVFCAAGRGLAAAHAARIVHRDFKPTNVLIGRDGGVFVADFGIAAFVADDSSAEASETVPPAPEQPRLTRRGSAMGTPAYMAPEQHEGRPVDARSDQFSFCIALYEALYGALPFAGQTAKELYRAKRKAALGAPRDRRIPRRVFAVLERGLSYSPDARYPDMNLLLLALQEAIPRRGRRRRMLGAASLAGLALMGLTAGTLPRDQGPRPSDARAECSERPTADPTAMREAFSDFAQAKRMARDPERRAEALALARRAREGLSPDGSLAAVELRAEIMGWLDAVEAMPIDAPAS
ncbi:MAG: serine/threonine protein kinase [Myxococcales bacterium]|nr:serine/threonine protein kinase [Myxococcales bacterium]MCB9714038.1 serine/threonine protein kinase [Myxococcales bacterium]